jgi:hypothetical protein
VPGFDSGAIQKEGTIIFMLTKSLRWSSYTLAILALAAGLALLLGDANPGLVSKLPDAAISSAPLLLVGVSFLILQPILRPGKIGLLKNVILAGTFLLWGAVQLMPQNSTAARLGDLVIALYVVDLAWVILGSKGSAQDNLKQAP